MLIEAIDSAKAELDYYKETLEIIDKDTPLYKERVEKIKVLEKQIKVAEGLICKNHTEK